MKCNSTTGTHNKNHALPEEYLNAHMTEIIDALVQAGLLTQKPDPLPVFRTTP